MAKTRDIPGKTEGGIVARILAWLFAPAVTVEAFELEAKAKIDEALAPMRERIFSWRCAPDEKKGYWRVSFTREDGTSFECIIDARPARKLSDDLMKAAAKMTLDVGGDTSGEVDRSAGKAFDIEKVRATYERDELARAAESKEKASA